VGWFCASGYRRLRRSPASSNAAPGFSSAIIRTELSKPHRDLFAKLDIPAPKQIIELAPASR